MRLDRATARRIAEALVAAGWIEEPPDMSLQTLDDIVAIIANVIVEAIAPAKPPGRTKRGKGKR